MRCWNNVRINAMMLARARAKRWDPVPRRTVLCVFQTMRMMVRIGSDRFNFEFSMVPMPQPFPPLLIARLCARLQQAAARFVIPKLRFELSGGNVGWGWGVFRKTTMEGFVAMGWGK